MTTKVRERIELANIDDNPWQPRGEIEPEALEELANSIQHMGLLQAPLGRPVGGRVQLAFGHRRVAALKLLHQRGDGEGHVDMDVTLISDEDMAVMGLTENERRKDLSQIETLRAYRKALDETELTPTALAQQLGIPLSTLSNNLRVLTLPDFILEHVGTAKGKLGMTVAREFLVLQNAHHAHHDNMRQIVHHIVDIDTHRGRVPPNWSRKNVRKRISENVSYSEKDFRPIGPKTGHETGGGHREATFDVDAFSLAFPNSLHTIPADDGHSENYFLLENYAKSRVWTSEVREWSRWQSRATRERNAQAEASGESKPAGGAARKPPSRDKQFEGLLAHDPVWQEIVFSREKPGLNRPQTDAEREALGSRSEFRDVNYSSPKFWKMLDRGERDDVYQVERLDGGRVPPWFPDLDECRRCTIGAAYAKSKDRFFLKNPVLACFNKEHYLEKLAKGEAEYREKLQANIKGIERQDEKAAAIVELQLEPLSVDAVRALAASLVSAKRGLDLVHPMGDFHPKWTYESATVISIRELLGVAPPNLTDRYNRSGPVMDIEGLDALSDDQVRRLAALLMAHHLRVADKTADLIDAFVATPLYLQEPTEEDATAVPLGYHTRQCTRCGEAKELDAFGQQKYTRKGVTKTTVKSKCKQCLVEEERERRDRAAAAVDAFNSRQDAPVGAST